MRFVPLLVAPLLLAACSGEADDDDDRTASGEVLEGTISDAMLPLDTVRSQPPLARVTDTPGEEGVEPDPEATDEAGEGEEAEPADEPAAEDEEN